MKSKPVIVVKLIRKNEDFRHTYLCGWIFSKGNTMDIGGGNLRIYPDDSGNNPIDSEFEKGVKAIAIRKERSRSPVKRRATIGPMPVPTPATANISPVKRP